MQGPTRKLALSLLALGGLVAGSAEAQRGPAAVYGRIQVPRVVSLPHVRVVTSPLPRRVWIPGRYEVVAEQVWIPGSERRVWVAPVFDTRCDLWGRPRQVLIAPGHWQVVCEPGRYETRSRRVWRPGHWSGC